MKYRRLVEFASAAALLLAVACSGESKPEQDGNPPPLPPPPASVGYIIARNSDLFDATVDGELRKLLTFDDGSLIFDPALSPDGKRIAFVRQEPVKNLAGGAIDFGADLYVVNRDGSGMKEIVHHKDLAEYVRTPSWLDADQLLFSVRGRAADGTGDYRIERLDLRSGTRTRVADNAVDPSVGPDLKQMVYVSVSTNVSRDSIVLASVDGSGARDLLPEESTLTLFGSSAISPDGKTITFAAGDLNGARAPGGGARSTALHPFFQDVWVIGIDGTGLHRLAELIETNLSLSWSPDGRWIYALGAFKFRRIDPGTGEITVLSEGAQGGIYFYEGR